MQGLTFHPVPKRLRDAKATGIRHFYTGKPCKRGHWAMRYSPSGLCIVCKDMHAKSLRSTKTRRDETNRKKREYWEKIKQESPDKYESALSTMSVYMKKQRELKGDVWERRRIKSIERKKSPEGKEVDGKARRARERVRMREDDDFIARIRWRQLLYRTIYTFKGIKKCRTADALGYTADELKSHVESMFLPGMTWGNQGTVWELDHCRPVSSFNKETCPSIVNALSNLAPMWKEDNRAKGNKWDGNQ